MKKTLYLLLSISLVACIIVFSGCAALKGGKAEAPKGATALGPTMVVATPHVLFDRKAQVVVMGTGFQPGTAVVLLISDIDGVLTDIGSALKPEPKVDATGTWATTWNAGELIHRKLIKVGVLAIQATDSDYNPIAQAPVNFFEPPKKEKK